MKPHKLLTLKRAEKKLHKALQGCSSDVCVFKIDDTPKGAPIPCRCGDEARWLVNQLDRELKTQEI